MFFFRRKTAYEPVKPQGHEGWGTEGNVAFSNSERCWEESFDLLALLEKALRQKNLNSSHKNGWLVVNDLYLRPEIVELQPREPSGVKTVTTVAIAHEKLAPNGLFEYQHGLGDDTNSALAAGFKGWIELDLPVFLDAVGKKQEKCTAMDMEYPEPERRIRRVLLGPVSHWAKQDSDTDEEHPFCPCCLFTNSFEAFRQHSEGNELYGIRLLVVRNEEGEISADCRVNGLDWEPGHDALIEYGKSWPDRGFEMRKQYVVVYTKG